MKKTFFYSFPKALILMLAFALTNCCCKEDDPEPAKESQPTEKGK